MRRILAILTIFLLVLAPGASVSANQFTVGRALTGAVTWLTTQQRADGGFAGFTGESDPGMTVDAVLALASVGIDPGSVQQVGGASAIAYLESAAARYSEKPGGAAKPSLAVAAPGDQPAPRANESIEGVPAVRLPVRAVSFLVLIIRLFCAQCTTVLRHPQQDAEGGVPLLPYAGT